MELTPSRSGDFLIDQTPTVPAHPEGISLLASLLQGASNGKAVLAVAATGDGQPLWSLPGVAPPDRLLLDLNAKRHRGFWASQLDTAVRDAPGPLLLVAEGFACLAIVRWAQLSPRRYFENVAGALLFSPLSLKLEQGPMLRDMSPSPAVALPFRSVVIEAQTSPSIARVLDLVATWRSAFVDVADLPDAWRGDSDHLLGRATDQRRAEVRRYEA